MATDKTRFAAALTVIDATDLRLVTAVCATIAEPTLMKTIGTKPSRFS